MEAQVSKSDLGKALRAATRAISRKPEPRTEGVHVSARASKLGLRATNGQLDVVTVLPATVAEPGEAVISPKSLGDSLKGGAKVATVSLNGTASVNGRDVSVLTIRDFEMPFARPHMVRDLLECSAKDLAKAIESVAFAADDGIRVIFQSVYIRKRGGTLTVVGANAYRMSIADVKVDNLGDVEYVPEFEYLVPAESVSNAAKALEGMERCIIGIDDANGDYLSFSGSGAGYTVDTIMPVVKEKFRSFEQLIPTNPETTWTLDPSELLVCSKLAIKKARDEFYPLRIDLKDGQMVSDVEIEGKEIVRVPSNKTKSGTKIECRSTHETTRIVGLVKGKSRQIGISPEFLAGALGHVTGQVTIEFSRYCCLITPTNGDSVKHVIMLVYLGEAVVR